MTTASRYIGTILRFHALWIVVPLLIAVVMQWISPSPDQALPYTLVYLPIAYITGTVLTAPVSIAAGLLVWVGAERGGRQSRSIAVSIVLLLWAIVAAFLAAMGLLASEQEARQVGMAILVGAPTFGLLMPLPR